MNRSELSNEEFALLSDPDARKKALADAPLTIKNRTIGGEAHRLDKGAALNDVHFVNCNFSGHFMFGVNMKNVSFTDCGISSVRWEGGTWEDIAFRDCIFVGREVSVVAGKGGGAFVYERCSFEGDQPRDGMRDSELALRGEISATGKGQFKACRFQRMFIRGGAEAAFTGCSFEHAHLEPLHENWVIEKLSFDECKGNYLNMSDQRYGAITIRNSQFLSLSLAKIMGRSVTLENVSGHCDLPGALLDRISATRCTFIHPDGAEDDETGWGLCVIGMETKSLSIADCAFRGKNARIVLHGRPTELDQHGKPVPWKMRSGRIRSYPGLAETITIKNTPLHHADFTYVHAKTVSLEGLSISDSLFAHSKFDQLTLKNVKLGGTLDFGDTQIKTLVAEGVSREPGLNLLKDKTTKIDL